MTEIKTRKTSIGSNVALVLFIRYSQEYSSRNQRRKRHFAIKSAYDAAEQRSRDGQMYGYQSLDKGQTFIFEVELTDKAESHSDEIIEALEGKRRIGRSRTA